MFYIYKNSDWLLKNDCISFYKMNNFIINWIWTKLKNINNSIERELGYESIVIDSRKKLISYLEFALI